MIEGAHTNDFGVLQGDLDTLFFEDKPHEACGVVGVSSVEVQSGLAATLAEGLVTLQHRGQEAAGVGVYMDNERIMVTKGPGFVNQVLGGSALSGLPDGRLGLGHVRYGTVGVHESSEGFNAAQPATAETARGTVALAHNGNLVNLEDLCKKRGLDYEDYPTDSHALVSLIADRCSGRVSLRDAVIRVLSEVEGAYSLVVTGEGLLIGARDPNGFRPLMLGSYAHGGYALASESHTLQSLGAYYEREIARGEVVVVNKKGVLRADYPFEKKDPSLCAFEYVYFTAPHGELDGRSVYKTRVRMGELLAERNPVDADIVIGIPESGVPASEGYSAVSGIPRSSAIGKNRDAQRTFIAPTQAEREDKVKRKFYFVKEALFKKRVVLVDDSIVRGTTMKSLVKQVRQHGATEVHLRISSAPYKWPCHMGMDTPDSYELIASTMTMNEIKEYLGVDSLEYLSLDDLRLATADSAGKLCVACMSGEYPISISSSSSR